MPGNRPNWLRRLVFRNIPERDQFETQEQFDLAIEKIARQGGTPRSRDWWIGLLHLIVATLLVRAAVKYGLRFVDWPHTVEKIVLYAAIFVTAALVIDILLRWGSAAALRKELILAGIPVCLQCGYSLRGHTSTATACPECGLPIDSAVREILQK